MPLKAPRFSSCCPVTVTVTAGGGVWSLETCVVYRTGANGLLTSVWCGGRSELQRRGVTAVQHSYSC